jgi:hypothetical protein
MGEDRGKAEWGRKEGETGGRKGSRGAKVLSTDSYPGDMGINI